jgi:hypothetical protein
MRTHVQAIPWKNATCLLWVLYPSSVPWDAVAA